MKSLPMIMMRTMSLVSQIRITADANETNAAHLRKTTTLQTTLMNRGVSNQTFKALLLLIVNISTHTTFLVFLSMHTPFERTYAHMYTTHTTTARSEWIMDYYM